MAAITCLTDYIGLRGTCNDSTPVSGFYVNDLPGISLKALANLSNDEQASYRGLWDEIQRRAMIDLEADVMVRMQKFFKPSMLVENNNLGYLNTPAETESASAYKKGIVIDLIGTKNMSVFLNHVLLYTTSAVSSSIYIYDYNTGVLLDTVSFTSVADTVNKIQINKQYACEGQRKKLFICYNAASINSLKSTVNPYWEDSPNMPIARGAYVANSSAVSESNMQFTGESYGLVVNFNVACSIQNFICSNRDFLKLPLWYKLGEQIMLEMLTTDRLNEYSMLDQERKQELKAYYLTQYLEKLDAVLNNATMQNDSICFPCEKSRNYKYMLL